MLRYAVNRARSWIRETCELAVMGGELRDTAKFSYRDAIGEAWALPRNLQEHPRLHGLFAWQAALSMKERSALVTASESLGYRPYESSQRLLAPILMCDHDLDDLRDLEVFHGLAPEQWLRPKDLGPEAQAVLESLTWLGIPRFGQFQFLERGTPIFPHIDAASPRADVVATFTLCGHADVRIGHVVLSPKPSDLYVLTRQARWDVKHEVLPSMSDRLSLTVRFVSRD